MDFLPVFIKMIELFLIIIVGYIANKVNIVGAEAKKHLSRLVLNITMPATILAAVMNTDTLPGAKEILSILVVAFLSYLVFFILGFITVKALRLKGSEKAVVLFAIMFSNVGFIGFPVTSAIFGPDVIFYTSIFNMPFNLLCYSLGVSFIEAGNLENGSEKRKMSKSEIVKLLVSPALLAGLLALVIALVGIKTPAAVGETFEIVGNITTPAALLIIGSALAEMPVKDMFNNIKAYAVTFVSVVVTPLVLFAIVNPFIGGNSILLGETVIIAAMPVATAGTMICVEYGGNEKFMAQVTFLTTLVSVVSIPLIAMIL